MSPSLKSDSLFSGRLFIVLGISSDQHSLGPSIIAFEQDPDAAAGTLQRGVVIARGDVDDESALGAQGARYGDYFSASVDFRINNQGPVLWVAGEYQNSTERVRCLKFEGGKCSYDWSTRFEEVSVRSIPIHGTTLTLNFKSNGFKHVVPWGVSMATYVTGILTDSYDNTPLSGLKITFSGTGAVPAGPTITNPDGTFAASLLAPSHVEDDWTLQAHFDGETNEKGSFFIYAFRLSYIRI